MKLVGTFILILLATCQLSHGGQLRQSVQAVLSNVEFKLSTDVTSELQVHRGLFDIIGGVIGGVIGGIEDIVDTVAGGITSVVDGLLDVLQTGLSIADYLFDIARPILSDLKDKLFKFLKDLFGIVDDEPPAPGVTTPSPDVTGGPSAGLEFLETLQDMLSNPLVSLVIRNQQLFRCMKREGAEINFSNITATFTNSSFLAAALPAFRTCAREPGSLSGLLTLLRPFLPGILEMVDSLSIRDIIREVLILLVGSEIYHDEIAPILNGKLSDLSSLEALGDKIDFRLAAVVKSMEQYKEAFARIKELVKTYIAVRFEQLLAHLSTSIRRFENHQRMIQSGYRQIIF